MALITVTQSVGRNGRNLPADVSTIGLALVAVGPDRGGFFAPPLSLDGLGQAIESFQRFQRLPRQDGRVDPGGATLRVLNAILNPGSIQPPGPVPARTGTLRPLTNRPGLVDAVSQSTFTPVEASLTSELAFKWTSVTGRGTIRHFELDDNVVPKWFGALVPESGTSFDKVHIFFHPTPAQAGFKDAEYPALGDWAGIFHYLSDRMGSQFCAAATGRVLIMPLLTQGAADTCGVFPQRWESIVGGICGMLRSGDLSGSAAPTVISSVVVSSFSSGISYSHQFRSRAGLGARLAGVIDFDGSFSTSRQLSALVKTPQGRVIKMQQMPATQETLAGLAARNVFPLAKPRWGGGPFANLFSPNDTQAALQIHGTIPQTMMFIAARRAG